MYEELKGNDSLKTPTQSLNAGRSASIRLLNHHKNRTNTLCWSVT